MLYNLDTKFQCLFGFVLFSSEDQETVCVDQKLQEQSHHSIVICHILVPRAIGSQKCQLIFLQSEYTFSQNLRQGGTTWICSVQVGTKALQRKVSTFGEHSRFARGRKSSISTAAVLWS